MKFNKRFIYKHPKIGDVDVEIQFDSDVWCSYEAYDLTTGGDLMYIEGQLETQDEDDGSVSLVGYDGCFELPDYIVKEITSEGVKNKL